MLKILKANADTYIGNRIIGGALMTGSNVGSGGSLDLYKLYGFSSTASGSTKTPNTELTRLLVRFNMQPLRDALAAGLIDPTNASFNAKLHLFDVYGGQPTPANFTVSVFPLSASFDEGRGRDIVTYGDIDVANWLTASTTGAWSGAGCVSGGWPGQIADYITASSGISSGASLEVKQLFVSGEEDLIVDVTTIVSATLAGLLPDAGFRIALSSSLETDTHTYFVKRFAARTAFDASKRPQLMVGFDNSIQDDSQTLYMDSQSTLFLYNYTRQNLSPLVSGSTNITGKNCLILKLQAYRSGSSPYELAFTGSQHYAGINQVVGVYSASVTVSSSDAVLAPMLAASGSLNLVPVWGSLDGTLSYVTGSTIKAYAPQRGASQLAPKQLVVTVSGLQANHFTTETVSLRVNIFDHTLPAVRFVKLPIDTPGVVIRDVHWQVRDAVSHSVVVPFDTVRNSTRVSSDASGMFFTLDVTNLIPERSYVIDIMTVTNSAKQVYKAAGPVFRVTDQA